MSEVWRGTKYYRIKVLDILICVVILISNIFFIRIGKKKDLVVIITPEGRFIRPLESEWRFSIDTRLGRFTIVNEAGTVRVVESFCPQKLCMKASVSREGGMILCRPNQIYIYLEGDIDAVTR